MRHIINNVKIAWQLKKGKSWHKWIQRWEPVWCLNMMFMTFALVALIFRSHLPKCILYPVVVNAAGFRWGFYRPLREKVIMKAINKGGI